MSRVIYTGGPAFPEKKTDNSGHPVYLSGMTLRDHFAGLAMQAKLMRGLKIADYIADEAYLVADSMLTARSK
jgi:hypothetical protein